MNTFKLELEATTWHYNIKGEVYLPVDGRLVQALKYHIERDPHQAEEYAMQIEMAYGRELTYEGTQRGNWPSYAKRMFEAHMKETGQWWQGVRHAR